MYIDMMIVGRKAVQMLSDLKEGKLIQKHHKVESTFVRRQTTLF